jgi:steroid 5-alpha reductase family enzyme
MSTSVIVLIGIVVLFIVLFCVAHNSYDDSDVDMNWYDNYTVIKCPHTGEKTDVVVESSVTLEVVHTICVACGEVLNIKIEC